MSLIGSIFVKLGLDNSGFKKGMDDSEKQTGKFSSFMKGIGPQIAAAFSVTAIIGFAKKSVQAYNESALAAAKLNSVIMSTGGAAQLTSNEMIRYASQLQEVTMFEDDATINAMALLSTFKSIKGDIFKQTIASAQDLATVLGSDLQSAVMQLGKALETPEIGLTMLRRSGISFSTQQIEQIKQLVAEGKKQEAQLVMLREVQSQFGGAAKAAGDTAKGAWVGVKNALGDLMETMGSNVEKTKGFAVSLKNYFKTLNNVLNSETLTKWEKFTSFLGGNVAAFRKAADEEKARAEQEERINNAVSEQMLKIKDVTEARRVLSTLTETNVNTELGLFEKALKKELEGFIARKNAIAEETEAIANGLIPQTERLIEASKKRADASSDQKVIRAINDETAALEKKLAVLKMTTAELMRYDNTLKKIPSAPSAPSGVRLKGFTETPLGGKGGATTSLNNPKNPISIEAINANDKFLEAQRQFNADFEKEVDYSAQIADRFGSAVAQSMSDSMQEMADAIIKGEKIDPSSMVKSLLMPFADMAIQMGEIMVATGVAALAAKAIGTAAGGVGAIAAGAALMAIGSAASAAIGSIGSSSFGGGDTGSKTGYTGGYGGFNTASAVSGQSMSLNLQGVLKGEDIYLSVQKTEKKRTR